MSREKGRRITLTVKQRRSSIERRERTTWEKGGMEE